MAQNSQTTLGPPPRIGKQTFMAAMWFGVALGALLVIARVFVRLTVFRRLFVDDGLTLFAWLLLLISTILWQTCKDALYVNIEVSAGKLYPPPPDMPENTTSYLRKSIAVVVLFYTGLWSIKLSFLVFFRRLGQNVRNQKIIWWTVLCITGAAYFACVGTIEYHCLAGSFLYIEENCLKPNAIEFERQTLQWNMIMDVLTDVLIICIPINMLWKVQISIRQKLALAGIFSLTVIIMIFAIIRVAVVSSFSKQPDQTWLYLWTSIEQTVSIIVACLASFRALFTKSTQTDHKRIANDGSGENPLSSRFKLFQSFRSKVTRSATNLENGLTDIPSSDHEDRCKKSNLAKNGVKITDSPYNTYQTYEMSDRSPCPQVDISHSDSAERILPNLTNGVLVRNDIRVQS